MAVVEEPLAKQGCSACYRRGRMAGARGPGVQCLSRITTISRMHSIIAVIWWEPGVFIGVVTKSSRVVCGIIVWPTRDDGSIVIRILRSGTENVSPRSYNVRLNSIVLSRPTAGEIDDVAGIVCTHVTNSRTIKTSLIPILTCTHNKCIFSCRASIP